LTATGNCRAPCRARR